MSISFNSLYSEIVSDIRSNFSPDLNIFKQREYTNASFNNMLDAEIAKEIEVADDDEITIPSLTDSNYSLNNVNMHATGAVNKIVNVSNNNISQEILDAIDAASEKYGIDKNLIKGLIKQESSFRPNATSPSGAQGLMQLMPATARSLGVTDSYNIQQNVDGGTKYLRNMLDTFDGNINYALAAYNAGPGAVKKYNGIPPYSETQHYVPTVIANMQAYANLEKYETPISVASVSNSSAASSANNSAASVTNSNVVAAQHIAPNNTDIAPKNSEDYILTQDGTYIPLLDSDDDTTSSNNLNSLLNKVTRQLYDEILTIAT